jgi:hypothetical protein
MSKSIQNAMIGGLLALVAFEFAVNKTPLGGFLK